MSESTNWVLKSTQMLTVNQRLAVKWRDMMPIPNDRGLSDERLTKYRVQMLEGLFRPMVWADVEVTGDWYRINGKHTSTLLSDPLILSKCADLVVFVEHYRAPTMEQASALYATFDSRDSIRSQSDINRQFSSTNEALSRIPSKRLSAYVTGLCIRYLGWQYLAKFSAGKRSALMFKYIDRALWLENIFANLDQVNQILVRRGAVIAAMLATYDVDVPTASVFWNWVVTGEHVEKDHQTRVLREWLMRTIMVGGRRNSQSTGNSSGYADAREFYTRCIQAWNGFRKNQYVKLSRYHSNTPIPQAV